ncbi:MULTISPECIES: DNA gyrase inhibitor YacG [Pseudoalteromonas]|uniref:DNA gyrase inhibitor YacG n=1 Tax=Pseudoalteromonas ruthenica TaxID=151081 RepID=A0A0F4Q3A3_9GAMM|nr:MULTISPECIES: DNA gyrase inhibitor YacG [Pseudoalteromonas]KJY97818.1 DNA gyrase inhibitor [Pseudoalteromonas ruthenica]KJZ01845.1 DNA gyrase inhibitor [Pseudoalteromonas ruthenica]MCG7543321.1 DNA gyrase inhibitor YacG [Pseudoalteromonas sp. MM17-2]MCG7567273.1 DNA gyrase inhibitor YacG [Pseudoalteromonas sp. CnMc7-15]MCG7570604.1 DNA gyrase inhibitor YacG [Pseudoalteromonas sp. CNC9-20]|tara:strand:- start:3202 stop:3441 length:240 start_codon:yes stop_codon:yes gene_type:complete
MPTIVKCPTCEKQVTWSAQSPYRPFCSKRCQLIDLGEWSSENNKISTAMNGDSEGVDKAEFIEEIEAMLAQNDDSFFKD